MTKLTLSPETNVSVAEFEMLLRETMETANPVDDLLSLADELHAYEQQHGMSSPTFFAAYEQGELPESVAHEVAWAATYDMFLRQIQ
jgi:hypothetical protein